jgi:peptidyl-prolyl cis-trans isomerase A (cyclophilin A)
MAGFPIHAAVIHRGRFKSAVLSTFFLIVTLCSAVSHAGTIVRISTTYGDFSVELLDEIAPRTSQNFLNYVNRGAYNGTFLHRLERGFVLQGGGYSFRPFVGPIAVSGDPPVVNEFSVSNSRGTLAMAKLSSDPDSATSQWFINLADNGGNLDSQNGGFTVFARVLGDGMAVVDAIAANPSFNLGGFATSIPLRADTSGNVQSHVNVTANNFININTVVTQRYSSALHVFEYATGRLILSVDGGAEGVFSLNLSLVESETQIVFELNVDSMVALSRRPDGAASWSATDGRLRIPVVELNNNGAVSTIRNVVMVLSDPVLLRFTLESYEDSNE